MSDSTRRSFLGQAIVGGLAAAVTLGSRAGEASSVPVQELPLPKENAADELPTVEVVKVAGLDVRDFILAVSNAWQLVEQSGGWVEMFGVRPSVGHACRFHLRSEPVVLHDPRARHLWVYYFRTWRGVRAMPADAFQLLVRQRQGDQLALPDQSYVLFARRNAVPAGLELLPGVGPGWTFWKTPAYLTAENGKDCRYELRGLETDGIIPLVQDVSLVNGVYSAFEREPSTQCVRIDEHCDPVLHFGSGGFRLFDGSKKQGGNLVFVCDEGGW